MFLDFTKVFLNCCTSCFYNSLSRVSQVQKTEIGTFSGFHAFRKRSIKLVFKVSRTFSTRLTPGESYEIDSTHSTFDSRVDSNLLREIIREMNFSAQCGKVLKNVIKKFREINSLVVRFFSENVELREKNVDFSLKNHDHILQ